MYLSPNCSKMYTSEIHFEIDALLFLLDNTKWIKFRSSIIWSFILVLRSHKLYNNTRLGNATKFCWKATAKVTFENRPQEIFIVETCMASSLWVTEYQAKWLSCQFWCPGYVTEKCAKCASVGNLFNGSKSKKSWAQVTKIIRLQDQKVDMGCFKVHLHFQVEIYPLCHELVTSVVTVIS